MSEDILSVQEEQVCCRMLGAVTHTSPFTHSCLSARLVLEGVMSTAAWEGRPSLPSVKTPHPQWVAPSEWEKKRQEAVFV